MTTTEIVRELMNDAKSIGIRLDFGPYDTYVTLYHGTSKKCAGEIRRSGHFQDGYFFSNPTKGGIYSDASAKWYAKSRGEKDGSGPEILKMKVDPNSFFISTSSSELESRGDLWLWKDGIWRNKKEKMNYFDFKSSKEIAEMLNIQSLRFVMDFAMSMLRHKYFNLGIKDKKQLLSELKEEMRNYLEQFNDRPKALSFQAKKWKCTREEFVENINKFLDMKSLEPLIKYPEIKENRLLKFIDYCKLVE